MHCRELASQGYIVFALDHHDGSCNYTEKVDGSPVEFITTLKKSEACEKFMK